MTEIPSNSFQPTPPPGEAPVSTSTAQRPRRQRTAAAKPAKKAAAPKPPKVPKNLHAVTDAEIVAGAAKKKRVVKKAKVERVAPDTVKVSLKEYAEMRCAPVRKEFLKAHKIISSVSGLARSRLLEELNRLFG